MKTMRFGLWVILGILGALLFGFWGVVGGILIVEIIALIYGWILHKGTLVPQKELVKIANSFIIDNPKIVAQYFNDSNIAFETIKNEIDNIFKKAALEGECKTNRDFSDNSIACFFEKEIELEPTTQRKEYLTKLKDYVIKQWY
jgi:hypothetical protein